MLSIWSLSTRVFQPQTWTRTAQSLWALSRTASSISQETKALGQDTEVDQESALAALRRGKRNAHRKRRYHNDDEFRKRILEANTRYFRTPEGREKMKAHFRELSSTPARKLYSKEWHAQRYEQSLQIRRARALRLVLHAKRWIKEGWTWKLHTPVKTPDRVDRHCTACHQNRFLMLWWATKAEPTTYLCNMCFANDFDLMVPEGTHKKLPAVFTSPHLPESRLDKAS